MDTKSKVFMMIACPNCGNPVKVEFASSMTQVPSTAGAEFAVHLTQSAPMICLCGFTHA